MSFTSWSVDIYSETTSHFFKELGTPFKGTPRENQISSKTSLGESHPVESWYPKEGDKGD